MNISLNFTIECSCKQVAPPEQFSSFHFIICYKQVTPPAYFILTHHFIKQASAKHNHFVRHAPPVLRLREQRPGISVLNSVPPDYEIPAHAHQVKK
jgi:hypothetical protein